MKKSELSTRVRFLRTVKEEHGGKCRMCGYNKSIQALSFHHVFPETKKHREFSRIWNLVALRRETSKCILVCLNCHNEIENKYLEVSQSIKEEVKRSMSEYGFTIN